MLVRKAAIRILHQIIHASVKADVALDMFRQSFDARDRSLLHELVYGVLRRFYSLEADMSRYCKSKPDDQVHLALLLGTYQLRHMRVSSHAAVSETVSAIKVLCPKAAGFVNAVLRHVAKNEPPTKLKPNQRNELPRWMYARWRDAFGPDQVQQFCAALKLPPSLCVAVFEDRDGWIEQVREMGITAVAGELSPYAVLLPKGTHVTSLPGFEEGDFTVMDQAAQAAVMALDINQTRIILDLCAAPGGKTAMLSHRFPDAQIIAVELNARRMPRLQENMNRLVCANVQVLQADALHLPIPDTSVDAILLDAPCSASGVLRRHPDAKFLHDELAVQALSKVQAAMIQESLRVLKADGQLVYAVCSIHPEENEQAAASLSGEKRRLFPSETHDGFYIAKN
jgi:16S rRNA (cytosine967-C5)-methyltransferase